VRVKEWDRWWETSWCSDFTRARHVDPGEFRVWQLTIWCMAMIYWTVQRVLSDCPTGGCAV
jgi:hypothetical protein